MVAGSAGKGFGHPPHQEQVGRPCHEKSAGATIGVICGRTVVRTNGEPVGRQRQLSLFPVTDPQGTGVGVGASLSW